MNEYIHIGKLVATFGVQGELILQHVLGKKTPLKNVEAIFVENLKGSYLPYFVEQSKGRTVDEIVVKLEGLHSREAAHTLVQKKVWLLEADFRRLAAAQSPLALIGFSVIADGENIGPITGVNEQPHQILLEVDLNGNEALIPLHEESLLKIDQKRKEVHVQLPEGLLDLYR